MIIYFFKKIDSNSKIAKGDEVFTSEHSNIYPPNLKIGTVNEVLPDAFGLTKSAKVTPAADLYDISHVIVLTRGFF